MKKLMIIFLMYIIFTPVCLALYQPHAKINIAGNTELTGSGTMGYYYGAKFMPNESMSVYSIVKNETSLSTIAYILNSSQGILIAKNYTGIYANFTAVYLEPGKSYYIAEGCNPEEDCDIYIWNSEFGSYSNISADRGLWEKGLYHSVDNSGAGGLLGFFYDIELPPNISEWHPANLTISYPENSSLMFNVTANIEDDSSYSWFLDGIFQAIGKVWTWIIDLFQSETNNPHNVTVIVSGNNSKESRVEWNVNITQQWINLFYQYPANISYVYETISSVCLINQSVSSAYMQYKFSSSSTWINFTSVYNETLGGYYGELQTAPFSTGYMDFRCIAIDGNYTVVQTSYNSVYVYEMHISPIAPFNINPVKGSFDTSMSIQCIGSQAYDDYPLYYDFDASYVNPENQSVTWQPLIINSTSDSFTWNVLNLPEQSGINLRCRANDGDSYTEYYEANNSLNINHGMSLQMFHAAFDPEYYEYDNVILANYCNVEGLKNAQIDMTWADCNNDGQYDYVFQYSQNETSVYDYFTCIYTAAGEYQAKIGCVMTRANNLSSWDTSICKGISEDDKYCNYEKLYNIRINKLVESVSR